MTIRADRASFNGQLAQSPFDVNPPRSASTSSREPFTRARIVNQTAITCGETLLKLLNEPNVTWPLARAAAA